MYVMNLVLKILVVVNTHLVNNNIFFQIFQKLENSDLRHGIMVLFSGLYH
jgi:hypothetical protein